MIEKWNLNMEERKIWISLGGSVLLSFLLAILVILFDTRIFTGLEYLPTWTLTSVDLAREILSLLAGSLFSVATFTFATMLTIITLYTSNFSPRAIENFLLNRTSMQTLGIFLGGFIYCLSSLFFMRSSEDEFLVVSATVALLYAFGSVITFTRFVYTSSQYVQLEKLIHSLYEEAQDVYDNYIKRFEDFPSIKHLPEMSFMYTYDIEANMSAYVEHIIFENLKKIADENDANIIIIIRVGNFVTEGEPIAEIKTHKKLTESLEEITASVNQCFSYESEKSAMYDPDYARTKLTEVALRAVSPGINDPNTAIHVLHYKSLLEKSLAGLPGKYVIFHNDEERDEVQLADENKENSNEKNKEGLISEGSEENKAYETEIITVKDDDNDDGEKENKKKIKVSIDSKEESERSEKTIKKETEQEDKDETTETIKKDYQRSVFYRYNDFAEDLHTGYWQLVFYMQKDISGVHALFEALKTVAYTAHEDNLSYIKEYNDYLYNMTIKNFDETFDRNIIERDYDSVKTLIEKKKVENKK